MVEYMKKIAFFCVILFAMGACDPQIPDSGEGVGFNDSADYELERTRREAALQGTPLPTGPAIVPPNAEGVTTSDLAAAGIGGGTSDAPGQTALASNPDISDEQNFDAVANRESIESDAERRARQAAAYQLIEATALPVRNGRVEPNIVQYALQAPNNRGESVFGRSGLSGESRFQRNCAKYRTPDAAQRDFLTRGGPQRDRLGIDPDGDGFACGWDPQAFRAIASGT